MHKNLLIECITKPTPRQFFPKSSAKSDTFQYYEFIRPSEQLEILRDDPVDDYSYAILPEYTATCKMSHNPKHFSSFIMWLMCVQKSTEWQVPSELKEHIWGFVQHRKYTFTWRKLGSVQHVHVETRDVYGPESGRNEGKRIWRTVENPMGVLLHVDTLEKRVIVEHIEKLLEEGCVLLNQNHCLKKEQVDALLENKTFRNLSMAYRETKELIQSQFSRGTAKVHTVQEYVG
jgi:hypothetical protein